MNVRVYRNNFQLLFFTVVNKQHTHTHIHTLARILHYTFIHKNQLDGSMFRVELFDM